MAQIEILLEKQLLTIQNREIIASGDVNVDKCIFTFDEAWEGYTYTAVFYQDKTKVQYAVLDRNNTCVIPAAAMMKAGRLYIGVFGVKDTSILTSTLDIIDIKEGAISGDNLSTEPTDDVFLAIIAQYQAILDRMTKYDKTAEEFSRLMAEQNAILEALNAFDVVEIQKKLEQIEAIMLNFEALALEIKNREIILRDVPVRFVDKVCRIDNEAFTELSLCDVYFDAASYELASTSLILPVSHDGYMELHSSVNLTQELNANILIRRE